MNCGINPSLLLHLLRVSMVVPSPSERKEHELLKSLQHQFLVHFLFGKHIQLTMTCISRLGQKKPTHTHKYRLINSSWTRSCGRWKSRSLFISLAAYPAIMEDTPSFHHPFFQTSPRWYIFKQRTFECGVPCLTLQPAVFPRVASIPPHCPTVNLHHALHFYYLFPSLFMTITSSPYQYIYISFFHLLAIYIYMYIILVFSMQKKWSKSFNQLPIHRRTSPCAPFVAGCEVHHPATPKVGNRSRLYTPLQSTIFWGKFSRKKGTPSS